MAVNQVDAGISNEQWLNAAIQGANIAVTAADNRTGRKWQEEQMDINRDFQREMYQRQLDDSIAWRSHIEEYNSPAAQMQRFKDAGINPMYAVTGGNSTQVVTPMQANGSGYGSSNVSPYGNKYQPLDAVSLAQTKVLGSQALMYQAEARKINAEAFEREFENEVLDILSRSSIGHDSLGNLSYNEYRAQIKMDAAYYEEKYQSLEFKDAKAKFLHSEEVRKFERDLNDKERKKFQYEISECKSAAEIMEVSSKWARANQWIDAGAKVIGSATGMYRAFRKPSVVSESHYYGDRHVNVNNY